MARRQTPGRPTERLSFLSTSSRAFFPYPRSALATIFPATLGPAANPLQTPEIIKPEWFFYVAFRWLKLFSGTAAILSMGFVLFLMFTWPFIDALIRKRTRFKEASVWVGILGVLAIIALTVWEAIAKH